MAQEPDIDVGAITEALNNKTDTDVQNTTTIGSAQIANFAAPSDTAIAVTWGTSGFSYTAPADGWISGVRYSTSTGQYFRMKLYTSSNVLLMQAQGMAPNNSQSIGLTLPMAKGQKVTIDWSAGTADLLNFVYAKGSEPQS
jgi:hypothetical protein